MTTPPDADVVERWFLRRGIPHFIEDYSARTDILTAAVPFLALVFVGEVFVTFGDRHRGWQQAATFLATSALLLGAAVLVNRYRGRRPFALPDDVGVLELGLFVLVPAIAALLFGNDPVLEAVILLLANLAILALAYVATSYGLVPMMRWGFEQVRHQLRDLSALVVKTLPLLLLFSAFFLLNAEMWQVADELPGAYLALVLGGMVLIGTAFVGVATRTNIDELAHFATWADVRACFAGTPMDGRAVLPASGVPDPPPLQRRARVNVALVMFVSQAVQIVLVSIAVFAFYLAFGLLTIRAETLDAWIGAGGVSGRDRVATIPFLGNELVMTRQLLYVAAFVATFAGLQFAVQVVSDEKYRHEFASEMAQQVRQALAVRAAVSAGATAIS